ncbi:hypothetical protein EI200_13975 [Peribacillus simplex]|uniref:hypothetical protein n=1 Tax=Peribacillus simplex TaxID=1478 RepID=UPI000F63714E|nr:hypothetical protein [Peribacillus simplex]RRN70574.1 hypothetical protein EI200_13975 [Peribacillus simplex]
MADKDFGNEDEYLGWLEKQIDLFPEEFVLVIENRTPIGQLELTEREYEGNKIGYKFMVLNTKKTWRGGSRKKLHEYAF